MPKTEDPSLKPYLTHMREELRGISPEACLVLVRRYLALVEPLAEHFSVDLSSVQNAREAVQKAYDRTHGAWGDDAYAEAVADTRWNTALLIQSGYQAACAFDENFAKKLVSLIEADIHTIQIRSENSTDQEVILKLPEEPILKVKYWLEMLAYGQVSAIDWKDLREIPKVAHPLRVFLCHSSGDKEAVRELYSRLVKENYDVWFDEEKLLPGQDWNLEITKAVRSTDVVVICISSRSVSKAGYVQKEIKYALEVADEQPEGTIFLIPLRLDACTVPDRLRNVQWVDYFDPSGYKRLIGALRLRYASIS